MKSRPAGQTRHPSFTASPTEGQRETKESPTLFQREDQKRQPSYLCGVTPTVPLLTSHSRRSIQLCWVALRFRLSSKLLCGLHVSRTNHVLEYKSSWNKKDRAGVDGKRKGICHWCSRYTVSGTSMGLLWLTPTQMHHLLSSRKLRKIIGPLSHGLKIRKILCHFLYILSFCVCIQDKNREREGREIIYTI